MSQKATDDKLPNRATATDPCATALMVQKRKEGHLGSSLDRQGEQYHSQHKGSLTQRLMNSINFTELHVPSNGECDKGRLEQSEILFSPAPRCRHKESNSKNSEFPMH
jgi:hypothetical protein